MSVVAMLAGLAAFIVTEAIYELMRAIGHRTVTAGPPAAIHHTSPQGGEPMSEQYPPQNPQPGPPPGWQPPPPPKKKHTVRNVLLILTTLVFLGVAGCVALLAVVGNEIDKEAERESTVIYKVTGTSKKGSMTYSIDGGTSLEQANEAALPWSKTVTVKGLVAVLQVSAQNGLGQKGKITCSIELDGKMVKTATATGEGAIASCDHTR